MTDPGSTASATSRGPRPGARRPIKPAPAWLSLAALVLGLGAGIALRGSTAGWVPEAARALSRVGMLWARGLSLLVLPLIVALAMAAALDTPGMGRLGRRAVAVFLAMLGGGALLTVAIGLPLASLLRTDPAAAAALRAGVPVPAAAATSAGGGAAGVLLPSSVGAVLRGAMVLLLLLGAVLLGLALRRLVRGGRDRLDRAVHKLAEAMNALVAALLLFTPLGILALSFPLGLNVGAPAAGFLAVFVLVVATVLLATTGLLYPLTAILARTPVRRFARAAAPAQLVAMSTQSSLAALPALIEGGRRELGLPAGGTGFVLPLAASIFKLNRTVSGPTQLLLLTHAFGVPLGAPRFLLFVAASIVQSFFTPGVPGGGNPYFTMPLYVAAGAPVEGVILVAAVDPLLDVFKTLTNVTGNLSAAAIVAAHRPE